MLNEQALRHLRIAIEVCTNAPLSELTLHETANMVRPALELLPKDHNLLAWQLDAFTEFTTTPMTYHDGLWNNNGYDWSLVSATVQCILTALLDSISKRQSMTV